MSYFDRVIKFTLYCEDNNYKNHPKATNENDGAGKTFCGVTEKYDSEYFPKGKTIDDLTLEDIIKIYFDNYWNKNFEKFNSYKIAARVFDFGVNRGKVTSIKILQKVCNSLGCNIDVDGRIGKQTINAVNSLDEDKLYNAFIEAANKYYHKQVEDDESKRKFLKGWINRLNRDIEANCY